MHPLELKVKLKRLGVWNVKTIKENMTKVDQIAFVENDYYG